MSKTAEMAAAIEDEHKRVIEELIAHAVAPPLETFRKEALRTVDEAASRVAETGRGLVDESKRAGNESKARFEAYAQRVQRSAETVEDRLNDLERRIDTAVADSMSKPLMALDEKRLQPLAASVDAARKESNVSIQQLGATVGKAGEAVQAVVRHALSESVGALRNETGKQTKKVLEEIGAARVEVQETRRGVHAAHERVELAEKRNAEAAASVRKALEARLDGLWKLLQQRVDEGLQGVQTRQEAAEYTTRGVGESLHHIAVELSAKIAAIEEKARAEAERVQKQFVVLYVWLFILTVMLAAVLQK